MDNSVDITKALEAVWRVRNKDCGKRRSILYSDPWVLQSTENLGSSVRLSKLIDVSDDSGLDGPLTLDGSSDASSSLISLGTTKPSDVTDTNNLFEDDDVFETQAPNMKFTFDVEDFENGEFDFDEAFDGVRLSELDDDGNLSLDWDYSDAAAKMTFDDQFEDDEDTVFEVEPSSPRTSSTSRPPLTRLPSTGRRLPPLHLPSTTTRSESTGQYTEVSSGSTRSVDSQPGVLWRKRRIVLLVVDGREFSDIAVDYYMDYIHREPYIIVLVYCAPIPKVPFCEELPPKEYSSMISDSKEEARIVVASHQFRFQQAGVVNRSRIIHSDHPGPHIINIATDTEADMVVIGREPKDKMKRSYFSKIVTYLNKHSDLDVNVYPPKPVKNFNCCGFPVSPPAVSKSQLSTKKKEKHRDKDTSDSQSLISAV